MGCAYTRRRLFLHLPRMRWRWDSYLRGKLEVVARGRYRELPSMDRKEVAPPHQSSDVLVEVREEKHIPHPKQLAVSYMEAAPEKLHDEHLAMDC